MIAWWQIILLTALAFWMILDQLTLVTINSPLLIGMISGIIMGGYQNRSNCRLYSTINGFGCFNIRWCKHA